MSIIVRNRSASDIFWAVDFDRCLGNVDVLFDSYVAVLAESYSIDPNAIMAARREVEASRGSFDLIAYLRDGGMLSMDELERVERVFIDAVHEKAAALMPGAKMFLSFLEREYAGRYGIITYGNRYWQLLKIQAAGLGELPCMVVDSPHKARQIRTWYDEASGTYRLPDALQRAERMHVPVREVILVDDKVAAFDGLHHSMRGYLVGRHSLTANQMARVVCVPDLGQIEALER